MEELQRVSIKTAKYARSKKFYNDVPCNHALILSNSGKEVEMYYDGMIHKSFEFICWIPYQAVLQKWLRDKHNLNAIVSPSIIYEGAYDWETIIGNKMIYGSTNFKSYEEAMEEALLGCLDQI